MNAGGMSKACKLNDSYFFGKTGKWQTGAEHIGNLPRTREQPLKRWLIHDIDDVTSVASLKGPPVREGPMSYQLVGEVMAHQGYDGYRA